MKTKLIKYLTLTSLILAAPGAWAETIDCTAITTLPTIITTQGIYCLTGNLTTSMTTGNAIEIKTNNVTIDLNGWKLGGLAAGAGTLAKGIYAWQRKNITIRNGTVRGFYQGIFLNDSTPYTTSQGHLVEDIRTDKNTFAGIWVIGRGSIVRRNQVLDTGGSTENSFAYGIILTGPGVRTLNNDISRTAADSSSGFALYLNTADGAVVEGNRIDDTSSVSGSAYGVYIFTSNDVLARGNNITSADYGIYYKSVSNGKYMDNLTSSITTTAFTGGTSVGTNN